jgi:Flp pilus assembly protein TadG
MAECVYGVMNGRACRGHGDRGSVLPLVAIGLVLMLVMAAFAIDLGNARQAKGLAQSTTDSAALAGAAALAGVTNGASTPPAGISQAVWDAASWAFKNLSLTAPTSGTKPCDNDDSKTCFSAGDAASTRVEVTTPYTTTRVQPNGKAYTPADLLHVKTCWNNDTFIANVIGISTIRVCSEATAHVIGKVPQNTDDQDDAGDPFALCPSDTALFDTGEWLPSHKATKDIPKEIPGKNHYGATYLYGSDLDQTSVKFTIGSSTAFAIGGQASAKVHEFGATSPYVKLDFKEVKNGLYKWEIRFTNYTAVDGAGVPKDAKNFKDTLPDGIYTFAVYAASLNGKCNQTTFSVVIGSSSKSSSLGPCQEDLFRGGTTPPNGTVIGVNDPHSVTATYYDETPPFVPAADVTDANVLSHKMHFWVKGGPYTDFTDFTSSITSLAGEPSLDSSRTHEYKWKQTYTYAIPADFFNGEYTFRIQVYDSDQNKAGGDCGFAEWTINFQGGKGGVELIE